jgi:serine protease Do
MTIRTVFVLSLFLLAAVAAHAAPAPQTLASEAVEPGWLGVSLGSPESGPDTSAEQAGVKVIGVVRGSPAQRAGLRVRDVILSVDGKPVRTAKDVIGIVTSLPPGSSLTLGVSRRGEEHVVTPDLGTRPTDAALMRMFDGYIGIEAIELPPSLRAHFGAPEDAGVMISVVKPGGPAEAAGIAVGDVVFEIDGEPVRSIGALRNLISSSGVDNRLEMRMMRDGAEIVIEPLVAARPDREDP